MFKPIFCATVALLSWATLASAQDASSQQGTLFYQFFNRSNGLAEKVPKGNIASQITRTSVEDGPQMVGLDCYGVTYDPNTRQMCLARSHFITQGEFQGDYSAFYLCNLDGTNARLLQREREDYSGYTKPVADFTPHYASNGDLLFETNNRIARMGGDGSNVRYLTATDERCGLPSESGGVISFEKDGVCICDVQGKNRRRVAGFPTYYGAKSEGEGAYSDAKVSPDGRFVAVAGAATGSEQHDIYLINVETGKLRQITMSNDDELPCDWRLTP